MDWANERYVRLYTKDTGDWLMWPWQTRALFVFILRKADRAGVVHFGKGGIPALAAMVGMPSRDVTEWIAPLIEDGCIKLNGEYLCIPNYIAAQETPQSDKARQRQSRERTRDRIINATGREPSTIEIETEHHAASRAVTPAVTRSHELSRGVTPSHSVPSLAVPSLAKPSGSDQPVRSEDPLSPAERERVRRISDRPPPPEQASAEREQRPAQESGYDLAKRVWDELWPAKYREPYPYTPDSGQRSDDRQLQNIGRMAHSKPDPEAWLRHVMAKYLRDHGDRNWLDDKRHPLRTLLRDIASYGSPKPAPGRPRNDDQGSVDTQLATGIRSLVREAPSETPLSLEEQRKRAASLADMAKAIGVGCAK